MLFVGIDLAWSPKNASGMAVIEGDAKKANLLHAQTVFSDKEIEDYVNKHVKKENALIAIDAPLIVPNQEGRRIAEKLVGDLFRKYEAGAHPANRKRLSQWGGKIRGEEVSKLLEKVGFKHDPYIKKYEEARKFFEVYPHPSMVVLFKLDKILQYKAKPKRDYEFRRKEFKKYQSRLKGLQDANPSLTLPKEILFKNLNNLKAQGLKGYEDVLDAIFCAYIAYYNWCFPEKCAVLGDMERGYISTPVFSRMKTQLEEINSQKSLGDFS
jgi:predicted RNase H-like nuclease